MGRYKIFILVTLNHSIASQLLLQVDTHLGYIRYKFRRSTLFSHCRTDGNHIFFDQSLYCYFNLGNNYTFLKFKRGGKKVPNFTKKQKPRDHWQMSYLSIHVKNVCYNMILYVLRKILSTFSFQCIIILQKCKSLGPSSSTSGVDGNIYVKGVFCKKLNSAHAQFYYCL